MSVDFYVAVPAGQWPAPAAIEQCLVERGYPAKLKRFPAYNPIKSVTDGALVEVDQKTEAYLEGELAPAHIAKDEVAFINQRLEGSGDKFRVSGDMALMSVRVRSAAEMRAAAYVISSLIVCSGGFGFEPQGDTHGRDDFAKSLIAGAEALKGM